MKAPYNQNELEVLAERFASVQRVRVFHRSHAGSKYTFGHFVERPERYEQMVSAKLTYWHGSPTVTERFPFFRIIN